MKLRPWLSAAALLALVGAGVPTIGAPAVAAESQVCVAEASSPEAAAAIAKRCGARVEALSERTETSVQFANPDGTGTVELHAYPQRARKKDGSWAKLDATLQTNADGSLSPVASTVDLTLSGGGSGPLLTGRRLGHEFGLSFPAVLPKPVVAGAVATYPEVVPGVDLVVTAQETGFSEVLVVKDARAAKNPILRKLAFGTSLSNGLRWESDESGLRAVDATGRVLLAAPAPLMWDSARTTGRAMQSAADDWSLVPGTERSTVVRPGKAARTAPIGISTAGGKLTLTPDLSLLDDPRTEFPVYLDPTLQNPAWTMINSQFPGQSYWAYDKNDCPSGYPGGTQCAKVGRAVGYSMIYRSLFQFDTTSLSGKQILPGSVFAIDLLHSASCGAYNWTLLQRVGTQLGSGTKWENNAQHWPAASASTASHQSEACNTQRRYSEFGNGSLQSELETISANGWTWATWGLRAEVESDSNDWKKYDAGTAKLVVPVNIRPSMPDQLTVDGKACTTGPNRSAVSTFTPTLRVHVADGDGDTMNVHFAYARWKYKDTPMAGDFNGDGKDDLTFWRPSDGNWNTFYTGGAAAPVRQWGLTGDIPVTGDFNADNKTDALVWRPSTGDWYVNYTGGTAALLRQWGVNGDIPLAGDFNGDGKDDTVIWRPSDAKWYIWYTGGASVPALLWGENGDVPLTGDINGDNKDDAIIWRPSTGDWWVAHTGGSAAKFRNHGAKGDVPLVGDFNNDGKDDLAYYRPSNHTFNVAYTGGAVDAPRVNSGDVPVAGDFNGDGKADMMSWQGETGTWRVAYSAGSDATLKTGWGANTADFTDVGGGMQGNVPHDTYGHLTTMPLADGGIYTFRAQSNDAPSRPGGFGVSPVTHATGNCEFLVDVTKPVVPTVTSALYGEGTTGGGVAQLGQFTFASSSDVVSYRWSVNGVTNTATGANPTVNWTPYSGGAKTMTVTAIDRAGNEATKTHQFTVIAPAPALARWDMADDSTSTTLSDSTGQGMTADLHGGTLGTPGRIHTIEGDLPRTVLSLDGTDDYADIDDLLNTSGGFTVGGWVKLGAKATDRVIVMQRGTNRSAFELRFDAASDRWVFESTDHDLASGDAGYTTPVLKKASSTSVPQLNVWTYVVGSYDAASDTMRIYVDGREEGTATGAVTWDSATRLLIGGGVAGKWFSGSLAEVQVWDRPIYGEEVAEIPDPLRAGTGLVGLWNLQCCPDPNTDESGLFHDLNYHNIPNINQAILTEAGHDGQGLRLNGVNQYMATTSPVLHTDQSFTVEAWVRLAAIGGANRQAAISQDGANTAAFMLGYSGPDSKWVFSLAGADSATAPQLVDIWSDQNAVPGHWVHLVGAYDANAKKAHLYVDGVAQSASKTVTPIDGSGAFALGRQKLAGVTEKSPFKGDIDQVRAYVGVLANKVGPNIGRCLNAVASSSTPESWGWKLSAINDGIRGPVGWSSLPTSVDHTETVEFTFPQQAFSRVDLYPRTDAGFVGNGFPANFTIEVWNGTGWVAVVSRTNYPKPTSGAVQSFSFATQLSTKLRIVGTTLKEMQIAEVELFASVTPLAAELLGSNIATCSPAKFSSYTDQWGWFAKAVNDGVRGPLGYTSYSSTDIDHTEWVEFNFKQQEVNRVILFPRTDAGHVGENFPANFTIEVWDGYNWVAVVTRTGYPRPGNGSGEVFVFDPRNTSKVRVVGTSLKLMQFGEVEIYRTGGVA